VQIKGNEQHNKDMSKKLTIIVYLFTLTARFITAETTEVVELHRKKQYRHFQLLPGHLLNVFLQNFV
jgi:hypothetical protein